MLLTWSRPKNEEYYNLTNFTVQFRRSSSGVYLESGVVRPGNNKGYVRNLEPETDYVFRVLANNEHGSGASEELGTTTLKLKGMIG